MKIPKKYVLFVFGGITSTVVSLVVAFTAVLINEGLTANFLTRWLLRSFPLAFAVAYPTVLIVVPIVGRLMERITADEEIQSSADDGGTQTFARTDAKEISIEN